jgi:hypothetical protein
MIDKIIIPVLLIVLWTTFLILGIFVMWLNMYIDLPDIAPVVLILISGVFGVLGMISKSVIENRDK